MQRQQSKTKTVKDIKFELILSQSSNFILRSLFILFSLFSLFSLSYWAKIGHYGRSIVDVTQPAITCSKLTTETLEQGVKYVQS